MSIRNVSGLELMQAMVDGQIPMPPIAHVIPMRGVAAEHGRIVFEAQADERHLNPLGGVHGAGLGDGLRRPYRPGSGRWLRHC